MANPIITNYDIGNVTLEGGAHSSELLTFAGAGTVLTGTILARKAVADTVVAAADGGNTGNGTVTALTVIAGPAVPLVGAYNLEMTELGVKNGTAIGAAVATGTGNGTASAVAPGAICQAGAYVATCIDATVSGSEIFNVIAPDGQRLEDMTVGVAYSNAHFGITLTDGGTDFIVGDYWTITITDTGGLFKVEDPNGLLVGNVVMDAGALAVTVIEIAGMTFTITAGVTDFIVGDKFSLTVAVDGKMYPYVVAGLGGTQNPLMVIEDDVVATGSGNIAVRPLAKGGVRFDRLIIDADGDNSNITSAIRDELRAAGIYSKTVTDNSVLDNQ